MVHLGKISEVQTIGFQTPQKHYENQWQICMHFPEGTPLVGAHSRTMRGGREVAFLFFFAFFFFPPSSSPSHSDSACCFQRDLEMGWGRLGLRRGGGRGRVLRSSDRVGLCGLSFFSLSPPLVLCNILITVITVIYYDDYFYPNPLLEVFPNRL